MRKLYFLTKRVYFDLMQNKSTIAGICFALFFLLFVFFGKIYISINTGDPKSVETIQQWIAFFKWNIFITIFILVSIFSWASEAENTISSNSDELIVLNTGRPTFFASRLIGYSIFSFSLMFFLIIIVATPLSLLGLLKAPTTNIFFASFYILPVFIVLGIITQLLMVLKIKRYGLIPFFLYIVFMISGSKTILNIILRNPSLSKTISFITPAVYSFQADVAHLLTFRSWPVETVGHLINLFVWSSVLVFLLTLKGKKYECIK